MSPLIRCRCLLIRYAMPYMTPFFFVARRYTPMFFIIILLMPRRLSIITFDFVYIILRLRFFFFIFMPIMHIDIFHMSLFFHAISSFHFVFLRFIIYFAFISATPAYLLRS